MELATNKMLCIEPNSFEQEEHFYPRVLNAQVNPLVRHFMRMSNQRIALRYCHLNPHVKYDHLVSVLQRPARYLRWAGCDLMHVTNAIGERKMVIIETNSSPSGQKSMPLLSEDDELNGYRTVVESMLPSMQKFKDKGVLAVIYDKNPMEASGYAAAMADITREKVWLIPFVSGSDNIFIERDWLCAKIDGQSRPIRYAHRYVTQKPWNRLPVRTKTKLLNPIIVCLAGGRNKALAAKAYDFYNAQNQSKGLKIETPMTVWNVSHAEVPFWIERMGGYGVVKVPYSNAGQGVYTISSTEELAHFMDKEQHYDRFIVQSLIGHYNWSSGVNDKDKLFQVGTIPDRKGDIFVSDLRMMVCFGKEGWSPVAMYARRAKKAIQPKNPEDSWSVLGTNLSSKDHKGHWATDPERLLLMDQRDFNRLGLSLDEIIEAYVQTVLSVIAIDDMAQRLISTKGTLRRKLFRDLCQDQVLVGELLL
jgi:hypothetical protein